MGQKSGAKHEQIEKNFVPKITAQEVAKQFKNKYLL